MSASIDRWLGRGSGIATFLAPVAPGTLGALVTAVLAQGVDWINQHGWFGWWCAFLAGGLLVQTLITLYAIAKSRIAMAKAAEKWAKETDTINPLDSEFHKKRINLSDLANPFTRRISGKKFTDCELIGPANILLMDNITLNSNKFYDCDLIPTKTNLHMLTCIGLENCQIIGGSFLSVTIFLHPSVLVALEGTGIAPYYPTLTGDDAIDARSP